MAAEDLTKKELREILDTVLHEIDADPDEGPRLRAAAAPLRIEFPDLKLVVNVSPRRGRPRTASAGTSPSAAGPTPSSG